MKKFVVEFISLLNEDLTDHKAFGPFVSREFAEHFIMADVEHGKALMDEKGLGYGRTTVWNDHIILPSYGDWRIMEMVQPLMNGEPNHVQNW